MKVKQKKSLGIFLIILGSILILTLSSGMTGYVIFENNSNQTIGLIGSIFILIGIFLILTRNLAQELMESGAVITNAKKLRKIANKMGYELKSAKEGQKVYSKGYPLTVIPKNHISSGVYRNIIKSLATGESSFRKRTGYS